MLMRDRGLMMEQISPAQGLPRLSKFIPFTAEWQLPAAVWDNGLSNSSLQEPTLWRQGAASHSNCAALAEGESAAEPRLGAMCAQTIPELPGNPGMSLISELSH